MRRWLAVAVFASVLPVVASDMLTAQEAATEIVVTTNSDASNGDVSTVAGLAASPGPDGISLREAIEATNNDPGTYTVRFDSALAGTTITLDSVLPPLTGGGVTVDGDVDSNGDPDVTLLGTALEFNAAFQVASSGNLLHALALTDFFQGVQFLPVDTPNGFPANTTFADNSVIGLVMEDMRVLGILIEGANCGPPGPEDPCPSHNSWANTTITNNTIESGNGGIKFFITNIGDRVEGATITDNTIQIVGEATSAGIGLEDAGDSTDAHITDVVIARNSIEGGPEIGIDVTAGTGRAQRGITERVKVLDNHLHLVNRGYPGFCCQGIVVNAGSDSPSFAEGPPVRYLDDNRVRDVVIRGNSVTGDLHWGLSVQAGIGGGGRRNRVRNVRIVDNVFRSTMPTFGVFAWTGDGNPFRDRYSADNRISGLVIKANRIRLGTGPDSRNAGGGVGAGGVVLLGGHKFGRTNEIRDVRIARNSITTAYVGIKLIGGLGPTARRNRVVCVPLVANRIVGARRNISVRSNVDGASGNRASVVC